VAIALQQGGVVGKQVRMGNAVILEDDAFLHLLEEPGDGPAHPQAAALVDIGVKTLKLTRPVDLLLDHRSGGIDHLAQGVGAAPDD
jgi:hypothetical protein